MATLYFLQNSRLTKRIAIILPVMLLAGNFFCSSIHAAELTPFEQTIRILERWTSIHWGQDCFVWIVHYPEEIVDSWIESEAVRYGTNNFDREAFRKNFVSDLKLDTSETFLVSVYSFGNKPVNLNPVSKNISLFAASGERIKPSKYDSALDNPSLGIVQGLVFFPKQSNKDYVVGIRGMSNKECVFSFSPVVNEIKQEPVKQEPEKKSEVIVVNLPKKQPPKKSTAPVTPPPPPAIPPRPITPLFQEDSENMEEFVNSVKSEAKDSKSTQANEVIQTNPSTNPTRLSNVDNSYSSRETVLRKFLLLWADGAVIEMYDMLSDTSKKVISRENFAKDVTKESNIRSGIKRGDYRIDWIGEERAKIITTHKTLFVKSVATQTIGVTREGSSWKIVWY